MQVGCRHDDVGGVFAAVGEAHAARGATGDEDAFDRGIRADRHAFGLGEPRDRGDHLGEPAAGIEHALVEIEAAHEVVERGRRGGGSPEEDRRVPEDLPQDRVVEPARDVALE